MQLAPDFYVQLRSRCRGEITGVDAPVGTVQEGCLPPERWMQQVWRHQRVRRQELRLADGTPLCVLHPGFWNREAGPDFRGAILQFGTEAPRSGDVELDLAIGGWHGHGHDASARFQRVILHVVWEEADVDLSRPPVMALKPYLDAPLAELARWLDLEAPTALPENVPGRCSGPLRQVPPETLVELLRQAARVRLERKSVELSARARQVGWHGALWEGLLGALGYKHNAWAFRRLAELVPLAGSTVREVSAGNGVAAEAHLLGLAGLLPADLGRGADPHVRALWDCWWRERDALADLILPPALWRMSGIRPANRPERRLALAASWWMGKTLPAQLESWLWASAARESADTARELLQLLIPAEADGTSFWRRHWTFRSGVLPVPQQLLGQPRVTDLAMNVILPWFWARAAGAAEGERTRALVERCWENWPAGEDNTVLRLARQRLFGTQRPRLPHRALVQQGLLQISRDFCEPAGALCQACRFPQWVPMGCISAGASSGSA